jgi:Mn-dependent DtxR family transcriptional regulator
MSPGYTNTPKKKDSNLKSYSMTLLENFKKDITNSLTEIQENTGKQLEEALKEETQKSLKELQEKDSQTGKGIEQNHPVSKNGSRNNKEITKEDNLEDRRLKK